MTARRISVAALALGITLVLATDGPALANEGKKRGNGKTSATKKDNKVGAAARITFQVSGKGVKGSGPVTSVDPNWTPPACWYAPRWTPDEFEESRQRLTVAAAHDPGLGNEVRNDISDENQEYAKDDYNRDKEGEGMWWAAEFSPDATLTEQQKCMDPPFWVKKGENPDVPQAINPEMLAALAYKQIEVPGTKVELAPEGASKVNLPTWAWLDKGEFSPVSVTASVEAPGLRIEATTTAKPVALTLKPGTDDAELLPASGLCELNGDGSIGEPYAKGKADTTPPCGVVYRRSSDGGSFNLQATATWKITWTGSGGAGGTLPDGEYGNDQPVTVEEVQSVNR
ncbi:hypothetical protein [Streptomyces tsukubensis]|uniref:Secreted protein n=1 Tax=Streptomyces tsukubensis TaxID=83656 RepID=A0A1V4A6T4_9ACTN|nr:hypothetical protein [Streptomyces tsukubensis]OON76955.1 hypothetical protein B1H18_19525 [Streptomyces tsukubensis]